MLHEAGVLINSTSTVSELWGCYYFSHEDSSLHETTIYSDADSTLRLRYRFGFPYSEELTIYTDSGTNHYQSTLCTTTDQEAQQ